MPLKDRVRRALGRPSSSTTTNTNSTRTSSTTSSTTPSYTTIQPILTTTSSTLPAITLTKMSNSRMAKITSWRSRDKKAPSPPLNPKNREHHEMLSSFEMKFGRSGSEGRESAGRWIFCSGVSPMATRCCSVDLRREGEGGDDGEKNVEE